MDHQERTGAAVRPVESIRETGIDRQILAGIGIHQARRNGVEAFRRLTVAGLDLGPELTRPAADRISPEQGEAAAVILLPDLELGLLLEDAYQYRRFLLHVLGLELGQRTFRQRLHVPAGAGRSTAASGKSRHSSEQRRRQQRAQQTVRGKSKGVAHASPDSEDHGSSLGRNLGGMAAQVENSRQFGFNWKTKY